MKTKKVLIVDDNVLNRKVFEHIISQLYQFDTAFNGKEALEKIKSDAFDLVLMDIQMPVLDGINTLNIIKNDSVTDIPIIAVSAFANENDKDYFVSIGFDDFIQKPIKLKNLLETLHRHLNKNDPNIQFPYQQKSTNPELDAEVVSKLLKYNTAENIRAVYEEFVEESMQLLEEINSLIQSGNYPEIGYKLHIIKGNSGTLGAMAIYQHCQKFEQNIKASNFKNTTEEYLYLTNSIKSFSTKINSYQLLNP